MKGKWTCEQDEEDFEQEKLIKDWIGQRRDVEFEFQHINRKGNARNTLIRASISLDQKIGEDSSGTFADLIAGSDGRDLECGPEPDEVERDFKKEISGYLSVIGFKEKEIECLIKIMLRSLTQKKQSPSGRSLIDLEW